MTNKEISELIKENIQLDKEIVFAFRGECFVDKIEMMQDDEYIECDDKVVYMYEAYKWLKERMGYLPFWHFGANSVIARSPNLIKSIRKMSKDASHLIISEVSERNEISNISFVTWTAILNALDTNKQPLDDDFIFKLVTEPMTVDVRQICTKRIYKSDIIKIIKV